MQSKSDDRDRKIVEQILKLESDFSQASKLILWLFGVIEQYLMCEGIWNGKKM